MSERRRALLWFLAIVPFLSLALWYWPDGPGLTAGDYAHYLLHARALAEGRPYTDTGYIFNEWNWVLGPPAQPPGLPLTLAPILAVFGYQSWLIKPLMLAFTVAFLLLAGRYFARHDHRLLGIGVVLLAGLSPGIVRVSTQIGSDLPFAALLWMVIYLFDRPGEWRWGRIMAIVALGGLAMLYRTAGVFLIPAAFIFGLVRFRGQRFRALAPFAIWAAFSILALLLLPAISETVGRLSLGALQETLRNPWETFARRLLDYRLPLADSHLYPFPWEVANDLYHLASTALTLLGLVAWVPRARKRFLLWFAIVYVGALLVLPVATGRYFWPFYPLSVFCLLNGVRVLCRMAGGAWLSRRAEAATLTAAVVLAILSITVGAKEPRRESLVEQPDVRELFGWLQERAATEPMRVAFAKPRVLTWETGIPAMALFVVPGVEKEAEPGCTPSRQAYLRHLGQKRITHVVEGDYGVAPPLQRVVSEVVEACSEHFRLVFRNDSFRVYGFLGAPVGEGGDADRPIGSLPAPIAVARSSSAPASPR